MNLFIFANHGYFDMNRLTVKRIRNCMYFSKIEENPELFYLTQKPKPLGIS